MDKNGILIDLYDDAGIQHADPADPMPFEAGWTPGGAICVAHVRVPENGSLGAVAEAEPRLVDHIGRETCIEDTARAPGAIVFNRLHTEWLRLGYDRLK